MSTKENREFATVAGTERALAPADIWEPDVNEEIIENSYGEQRHRRIYSNEFHDDERTQFQRDIMLAGNDVYAINASHIVDDDDEEEDDLYEGNGLLDTRTLIVGNSGMFPYVLVLRKQLCVNI